MQNKTFCKSYFVKTERPGACRNKSEQAGTNQNNLERPGATQKILQTNGTQLKNNQKCSKTEVLTEI